LASRAFDAGEQVSELDDVLKAIAADPKRGVFVSRSPYLPSPGNTNWLRPVNS
jgi:hypothetical protein